MLKSPNRPRAPSAATLRVLYQLAYISSGTAVGIGALCAEERRRRTQIVQKIADNAKRIRQSPRYAHGAAAAAVKRRDFEDNFGWFGQESENGDSTQVDADVDSVKTGKPEDHGGAKMLELPSVVEEEYGRSIERNNKRNKSGRGSDRLESVKERVRRVPVAKAEVDAQGDHHARTSSTSSNPSKYPPLRLTTSSDGIGLKGDVKEISWYWKSYKRPMRYGIPLEGDLKAESPGRKLFHATKKGEAYNHPDDNYKTVIKSFDTHHLWDGHHNTGQTIPPETLVRDVDLFFDKVGPDAVVKMSKKHALQIANELLRLSFDSGVPFKAIQALLLWKIGVKSLSIDDLNNAAASFQQIARRLGPEKTTQFYADLFATGTYHLASTKERLGIRLRLHAEALELDILDEYAGLYEHLTEDIHVPFNISHSQLAKLLTQECGRLVDRSHLSAAVKLWCLSMRKQTYLPKDVRTYAKIDNRLFDAAIDARNLSLCAQMLRVKDHNCDDGNSHQKDAFIRVCFEEGALGMLNRLFSRATHGGLKNNHGLSPQSCAYLCRCLESRGPKLFNTYYRKLPVELRASVAAARVTATASTLRADWKFTRNLDHVQAKYELHLRTATEQHRDVDTRELHIAMIEIELSANRPVKAIEAISSLNEGGLDGTIATLTALALAKQQNWLAFGRLFEALRQDTTILDWTPPMKRAYNNSLHLFARSHTAEQLSKFLSMSINELRFIPNQSTWEILMSDLVSKKALAPLKYWIEFTGTASRKARVNAGVAATLMKTWYLDFRHSHALVIWFCRSLVRAAPALHSEGLLNVVRETIAFDLRKLHGVNAPWMSPIIRTRQALYEQLTNTIARPGYIWNGELYDNGRLMTADEPLPQVPALHEQDAFSIQSNPQTLDANEEVGPVSTAETWTSNKDDEAQDVPESVESAKLYKAPVAPERTTNPEVDAIVTSVSESNSFEASFVDLRSSYEIDSSDETSPSHEIRRTSASDVDTTLELSEVEMLERQMIVQLSSRQYDSVLEMYRGSLDAAGLPASPLVLEIAVDASLRINGDRHEAESLMSAAREAGMNVTCAMGPLIIDQIRHTPLADTQSALRLRGDIVEYYRMNELNGLHVKHHVGIHAAYTLIQAGFAQNGVNLLNTILKSSWSADKPLDIVAMSVWLTGYASLGHVQGMHWVINEVLDQRMNIDQGFLQVLKRARRPVHYRANGDAVYVKQEPKTVAYLRQWYDVCSRRREAQMHESKVFGRKLVNLLASAANRETVRTTTARRDRRQRLLSSRRVERSDRSSPPLSGEQRDPTTCNPLGSSEGPEGSNLPDRTGLLELSEHLDVSESSERSSPPLSGDQDDVRTWKPLGSSQRSERPGLFDRSELPERSQHSGHSSPPLSGEQRDVRTWKPFGMD
ncbi:hypothetical protein Q7P35_010663 [Cladosporium inversicolor]